MHSDIYTSAKQTTLMSFLKYYINVSFDTTYKQLAIEWGWERKAVMPFLRSLQKMGVLEIKRSSRYIHIHIKNLACLESEAKAETGDDSTEVGLAHSSIILIGKPNPPQSSILGERWQKNEQALAIEFPDKP